MDNKLKSEIESYLDCYFRGTGNLVQFELEKSQSIFKGLSNPRGTCDVIYELLMEWFMHKSDICSMRNQFLRDVIGDGDGMQRAKRIVSGWERNYLDTMKNPWPGVDKAKLTKDFKDVIFLYNKMRDECSEFMEGADALLSETEMELAGGNGDVTKVKPQQATPNLDAMDVFTPVRKVDWEAVYHLLCKEGVITQTDIATFLKCISTAYINPLWEEAARNRKRNQLKFIFGKCAIVFSADWLKVAAGHLKVKSTAIRSYDRDKMENFVKKIDKLL